MGVYQSTGVLNSYTKTKYIIVMQCSSFPNSLCLLFSSSFLYSTKTVHSSGTDFVVREGKHCFKNSLPLKCNFTIYRLIC